MIEKLENIAILHISSSDNKRSIYFPAGIITIYDLWEQLCSNGINFDGDFIVTLFYSLLNFVLFLKENSMYHADIKPENIIIIEDSKLDFGVDKLNILVGGNDKAYRIKIIDFGILTKKD